MNTIRVLYRKRGLAKKLLTSPPYNATLESAPESLYAPFVYAPVYCGQVQQSGGRSMRPLPIDMAF